MSVPECRCHTVVNANVPQAIPLCADAYPGVQNVMVVTAAMHASCKRVPHPAISSIDEAIKRA